MKRITCAFLSMLLITPCMANIHINPDAVTEVVAKYFPKKQVECIREYNAQLKASNGAGIAASKLWNICAAGGLDVKQPEYKEKCRAFVNDLARIGTVKFKAVCGDDKSLMQKDTGKCVDDVFSNKVLGGVKVNMLVAPGLAKEYARIKYGDKDLACSKKYRQTKLPPDDYVQCVSMNKDMAYEFKFDSVTATTDYVIDEGTESGVCKIFGLKYSPFGSQQAQYLGNGQQISPYQSWPAACETTDAKICSKVNESMAKFGRSAKIGTTGSIGNKHSACVITENAVSSPSQLRTAFGIDNYVFKKGGVQLNATQALKTQVCTYVRTTVKNPAITSCDCNDGFTQLYDFSGIITQVDDVLTCKINSKNVDFVFDDLSERNRKIATGGSQGMDCMAAGGTYSGQQCMYLDEKQCKMLAKANLQNCPTCKKVEYKNGVCQLPSGADAIQEQKDQRIALIVGGAVVGVVVTVATAGTAGAPVSAVVFTLVETGGAVMEYNAQVKIDAIADEFLLTSQECKSASCAEELVKQNLQRLSNVAGDMQVAERNAVDYELARLVGLLPDDSQLFIDIIGGESLTGANQKSLFDADSWESEQVWRAVGITLQMTSIFASVGKWVLKSTGVLAKDLPEATIKITSKAKLAREGIIKTGKTVKTTDGKLIVPMGRMAAEVDNQKSLVIGYLNEAIMFNKSIKNHINMDDFIQQLQKEGYRVEYLRTFYDSRQFQIVAETDGVADINLLQKKFLDNASVTDKDARLGAIGYLDYQTAEGNPNSWYNTYNELVTAYLNNEPDIMKAYNNWDNMSEYERYQFIDQTNRKIRRLINENPLPVSYTSAPKGADGSYGINRIGTKAKDKLSKGYEIDFDEYTFRTDQDFKTTLNHVIHENYHYSQDIGKSDTPDWLLDYNADNYVKPNGIIGNYNVQPIERPALQIGRNISKSVIDDFTTLKTSFEEAKGELYNIADRFTEFEDMRLNQLGKEMKKFISEQSYQSLKIWEQLVTDIKKDRIHYGQDLMEIIDSFDFVFFERVGLLAK